MPVSEPGDPATFDCSFSERLNDPPARGDRLVSQALGIETVIADGTMLRETGQGAFTPNVPLPGGVRRGGRGS